jgi:hypothetical protein
MLGGFKQVERVTAGKGNGTQGEASPPLAKRSDGPAIPFAGAELVDYETGPVIRQIRVITDLQPQLRKAAAVVYNEMLLSSLSYLGVGSASLTLKPHSSHTEPSPDS